MRMRAFWIVLFVFAFIISLIFIFDKDSVLFQPIGPTILEISPNVIYNSQPSVVLIYGSSFTPSFEVSLIVGGVRSIIDPSIHNGVFISESEIRLNLPNGIPPVSGEISITNQNGSESNLYPFEVRPGIAPPAPSIIQVTPINLQNPLNLEVLPVKVWGNNFDSNSKIILDGVDLTSRILSRDDKKIEIYLTKTEMLDSKQVVIQNNGNVKSNLFNINETTTKYPDLIHIKDSIVYQGDNIEIIGNNFFASNSNLYVDDIYVDPNTYTLTKTPTGNFKITLNSNNYLVGPHKIYFDNPPRYPNLNYNYKRLKSNKLYFEIKDTISVDQILENNRIKITFDGQSGNIKKIENKDTGYSHNLENVFPWRMIFRKINSTSQLSRDNPLDNPIYSDDQDLFNPFKGNCNDVQFSIQNQDNLQELSVKWPGCEIDPNNRFDFVQKFFLEQNKQYFETNFSMDNVNVLNYSIDTVLVYATIVDDPNMDEAAIIVDRAHETVRNPGFNVLTRGSRNLCNGWYQYLAEGQIPCGVQGFGQVIAFSDMGIDGEGIRTNDASWTDFWIGYWNQDGDYIYGLSLDNFTYAKGYSYQGEEGAFKNSAWIFFPDNYDYDNFNYKMPYAFRIGVGKGTTFTGDETWVNIADIFKEIQQSKGMIKTPFRLRGLSEHVMNLDLTTATGLGGEFFENVGGVMQIRANPNITQIANLYEESRKFHLAEESTILIWGGDQDDTQGYGKFVPIPGVSFPFYRAMNIAGWNPCFYTLNAGFYVRGDEPVLPAMIADGELLEFDPTGAPSIIPPGAPLNANSFANLAPGSTGLGPNENSYLKWFLDKYRVMNNNQEGARCFYSDGIFTASAWTDAGPRSIKYGYKGRDNKQFISLREFFKKEIEELRKIDPETYTMHEATSQLTTDEDLFPFQAATSAGALPQTGISGSDYKTSQGTQLYQRVYGGYIDFLLPNEVSDPNKIALVHIPNSYLSTLKAIPGVPQDYDKNLTETYSLPGWVGFLYKSAVPYYLEVGIGSASNYTPNYRLSEVPPESPYYKSQTFDYWVEPLEEYARLTKEEVNARQLARNYFHGLWHLPIKTNSPEEEYYYIADWVLFSSSKDGGAVSTKIPRVINSVRQALVGNNWAQKYGIMFINTYARQPTQTVDFTFSFERYGLTPGQNYNLFKYSKENGREYIRTVNNDFDYTITIPSRKFILYEIEIDGDGDNDGVTEIADVCPNTENGSIVNLEGCSVPSTTEFSADLTSNLVQSNDLFRYRDLSIGIDGIGRIEYLNQELRLLRFNIKTQSFDGLDLNDAIEISQNKIMINTADYPELDQTARITFYRLNYSQTPIVTINEGSSFIDCPASICSIVSYNSNTGTLVVEVAGFSEYSTRISPVNETSSGSGSGSGSSGRRSTGSSSPRNTIMPQCKDNLDNDGDGLIDYPSDKGCLNAEDNIELEADSTQGIISEERNKLDSLNQKGNLRVVFWITLALIIGSILIISIKIVRLINVNRRFGELSRRSENLNNAFNTSGNLNQSQ